MYVPCVYDDSLLAILFLDILFTLFLARCHIFPFIIPLLFLPVVVIYTAAKLPRHLLT